MTAARQAEDHGEAADALPPPPRSQNARRSISCRDFAPSAAILGSQVGFRAVGGPWWTFCLLTALGLAAVCLQIVFPQDSLDKLAWWSERRRTRRRCPCQDGPRLPGATGGSPRPVMRRARLRSLPSAVGAGAMLDVLHNHHVLRFVDPVQHAPMGTEARAVESGQLVPQRLTSAVRRLQEWAGDEFDSPGGHVRRERSGDRASGRAGHPELVMLGAHRLRSASSARAASAP